MQPSTDDLLIRQISALISATADAASTNREHVPFMEAQALRDPGGTLRRKAKAHSSICQKWSRKDKNGIDYGQIGTSGSWIGQKALKGDTF